MSKEVDQDMVTSRLHPGAAGIFLVMSGRAIEAGGCLIATDLKTDTIGRAAFEIYEGGEEGSLEEVIEEMTGCRSDIKPELLQAMTAPAVAKHVELFGVAALETA